MRLTRKLLLSYLLFFSIIAAISFLLSTPPSGASETYSFTAFDLFFSVSWLTWLAVFGFGGILVLLLMKRFDELSERLIFGAMIFALLMIFLMFFALPYAIEPLPRYWDTWIHGSGVQSIISYSHLTSADFNYLNYPASFLLMSSISLISGIDTTSLVYFFPFIIITLFFLFMIFAFRELTGNARAAIIATLIYGLSTYYLLFCFSPAIFGWLLFFLFIALFAKQAQAEKLESKSRIFFVVIIFILFAIGMTHPVTQAFTLLVTVFLFIFRKRIWQRGRVTLSLILLTAVIFAGWAIFFGLVYYSGVINSFRALFNAVISDLSQSYAVTVFSTSLPTEISNLILFRRMLYIFVPATAFFGLIFFRKIAKQKSFFLLALLFSGVFLAAATLYGALPVERSIQLSFIPLSALSAFLLLKYKKVGTALLVFLIATIPINFASYYWDEPFPMTHSWELSGGQFITQNFNGTLACDYKEYLIMKYYNGAASGILTETAYGSDIYNATYLSSNDIELVYVNPLGLLKTSYAFGQSNSSFIQSLNYDCIYSDSYSMILIDANHPNYTSPTP